MGSSPDIPPAPPAPAPPPQATDPAVVQARKAALSKQRRLAGKGRTLLTGPLGVTGSPRLGFSTLLGRQSKLGNTGGGA